MIRSKSSAVDASRIRAARAARRWLSRKIPRRLRGSALQRLGILLCERLLTSCGPPFAKRKLPLIPQPASIVEMQRGDLLALCRKIGIASPRSVCFDPGIRSSLRAYLGGLALSYAAKGDALLAAAISRAATHLGLKHGWLNHAEKYLLDQQGPDGGFGLVAPEVGILADESDPHELRLILTVEILWTLVARASLYRTKKQLLVR